MRYINIMAEVDLQDVIDNTSVRDFMDDSNFADEVLDYLEDEALLEHVSCKSIAEHLKDEPVRFKEVLSLLTAEDFIKAVWYEDKPHTLTTESGLEIDLKE